MNVLPVGAAATSSPQASSSQTISSDFQTFLRMLTAQIQNQDPLNPMDSSEYAVQLATFSSVEQQVQTNDLLTAIMARLGGSNMSDLAGWIGLEAQFGDRVQFDGTPVELSLLPDARADQAVLVVSDLAGQEVQRLPVGAADTRVSWQGTGTDGAPLASGTYAITLENFAQGTLLSTTPAQRFGTVVEARAHGGQTYLVLEGGDLILASDVTGVRGASAVPPQ